jgi:large subunit ribosomal protein L7/L12
MPPLSKDEIVEAIKSMSVLELSELSKELQEVFGVTPSAAVAVAAAPGAGGGAPAAAAEEAPTSFDVIMTSFGEKKINVIKVVREITGLGLKEAKDMVEAVPSKIKEGLNADEAKALKEKLEGEGASADVKPAG